MRTRSIRLILALGIFSSLGFRDPDLALEEIFPKAKIEIKNIILTDDEVKSAEALSGIAPETRLASFYIARKRDEILGYAYIDFHIVRSNPEAVLYVINPKGEIEVVEILHSGEPPEYRANEGWLKGFKGKSLDTDPIRLRIDTPNITGATMSAKAITDNTRKVLALWKVVFEKK